MKQISKTWWIVAALLVASAIIWLLSGKEKKE